MYSVDQTSAAYSNNLSLAPRLQARIDHLNLAGRLFPSGAFIPGGAYGDIAQGQCIIEGGRVVNVAIKRLRPFKIAELWPLLEKELYVWSKVKHDNVLSLLGYYIDGETGVPMLVSEWMDNGTAWKYMNSNPDADVLRLINGIARGLAYLHENGVVHSDIKSDNILVSNSGDARICDFGCSRMISASLSIANLSSSPKGTWRYYACELFTEDARYTKQTDVWAFGMMTFELVSLQRPYATLTDAQVFAALQQHKLPSFPSSPLQNLNRESTEVLRHVCESCWRFRPENRTTMTAAAKALSWQMKLRGRATDYALKVTCIQNVQWTSGLPCTYVEVRLGDEVRTTGVTETSASPIWNETLWFSQPNASEKILAIHAVQCSQDARISKSVGGIEIKLENLLDGSACGEVQLFLPMFSCGASPETMGVAHVYLKDASVEQRVDVDIETVRQSMQGASLFLHTVRSIIQQMNRVMEAIEVVAVKIQPYISLVAHMAAALYTIVSHRDNVDEKIVDVIHVMAEAFGFAGDATCLTHRTRYLRGDIDELLQQTISCSHLVEQCSSQGRLDADAVRDINNYKGRFLELKKALDSGIPRSASVSDRDNGLLQRVELLEKQLQPSKTDISVRPRCLPGTRRSYLDHITEWLFMEASQNILCLSGVAGSGKSTIAATIVDFCDEKHRLAAHLFFEQGKSNYGSIIRTIAYSLAAFDSSIMSHVIAAVNDNRNILNAPVAKQFERLLLEPLKAAEHAVHGIIIVVLDALDECGEPLERRELLRLLGSEFSKLPSKFRFLVTCRPEDDIVEAMLQRGQVFSVALDLSSEESRRDIDAYLDHAVRDAISQPIPDDFDLDAKIKRLAELANGLFIWASTAVKMVATSDDPLEKLEELVSGSQSPNESGLDDLYATVFVKSGISWHDAKSKERTIKVLRLVLFAKEALSDTVMNKLLGLGVGKTRLTLKRLRSVIYYEPDSPVRLYHASFADYITSPKRSGGREWFIGTNEQIRAVICCCFDVMENLLHFNICNLESSFNSNDLVPDLEHRVGKNIPPHLSYACRFWAEHLCDVPCSADHSESLDRLRNLAYNHLLYWLEVLSLTGSSGRIATRSLYNVSMWTAAIDGDLSSFLWDAYKLTSSFALPISRSAPHIYLSALSIRKGESIVCDHYSRTHPTVDVHVLGTKPRDPCIRILKSGAERVAVSSDGKYVASCSSDPQGGVTWSGTVRIWDAKSGELVLHPLQLDTSGYIMSVAFISDEKRVAVVSSDCSICVWSIESGEHVLGPFKCHSGYISGATFSPDGKCVATGFYDGSIRVWNVENGSLVLGPLQEHTDGVFALAFSRSGHLIISGSRDKSIQIWSTKNGVAIRAPFLGHTQKVNCVDISPDGKYIASGSWDNTIRIWSLDSGETIWNAHDCWVSCIAFSHDGKLLVSGNSDGTICSWEAANGKIFSDPLLGNTGKILGIAFFPDGRRLVSGSDDGAGKIWHVESSNINGTQGLPRSAKKWAMSVAFSPDGHYIASGFYDGSICIWDTQSSQTLAGPFKGHKECVRCITYSPDGTIVASAADDKSIRIWDAESGEQVWDFTEPSAVSFNSVSFSPDGKQLVSGCEIRPWYTLDRDGYTFDPAGYTLDLDDTSDRGRLLVWNIDSGDVKLHKLDDVVQFVMFSPDGNRIVSAFDDHSIRVYDATSGNCVLGPLTGHTKSVMSVAFSPDGRWFASGSEDKSIRIWNAETGGTVFGPLKEHTGCIYSVSFSPDGKYLASGSGDCSVRVWEVGCEQTISRSFMGHKSVVKSVAFSPCGKFVASGASDGAIRIWSEKNGTDIENTLDGHVRNSSACSASLSLDGDTVLAWSDCTADIEGEPSFGVSSTFPKECTVSNWVPSKDGWIRGEEGELIIWIPEDMRETIRHPCITSILNCQFSTALDFAVSRLGVNWSKGYPLLQLDAEAPLSSLKRSTRDSENSTRSPPHVRPRLK